MKQYFLIGILLVAVGCNQQKASSNDNDRVDSNLTSTETEESLSVSEDEAISGNFRLELGRGSGLYGLDTLSISDTGTVLAHKHVNSGIEQTSFSITPAEIAAILSLVESKRIMSLDREYHDERIADGTQWVLLAKQGEELKSIYCNNRFPDEITGLATELDSILNIKNRKLEWTAATVNEVETRLWDSLKDNAMVVTNPTKPGTYSNGDWNYQYRISGDNLKHSHGELKFKDKKISHPMGTVIETPLGKFMSFENSRGGQSGYNTGWLMTYYLHDSTRSNIVLPVFLPDGTVDPDILDQLPITESDVKPISADAVAPESQRRFQTTPM